MDLDPNIDALICYDLETTGRSYRQDRIVQFAATVLYQGNKIFEFSSYVCPESGGLRHPRRMSAGASVVTGINDSMLVAKPPFSIVWRQFIKEFNKHLNDKASFRALVFVGFNNFAYDDRILWLELRRIACDVGNDLGIEDDKVLSLDVFKEVKTVFKTKDKTKKKCILANYKLSTVYEYVTNTPLLNAHDAMADVHATIKVFEYLITSQKRPFVRKFSDVDQLVPSRETISVRFNKQCKKKYKCDEKTCHELTCRFCKVIHSPFFSHVCIKRVVK